MNMPQHTFKTDQETIDLRLICAASISTATGGRPLTAAFIEVVDPSTERVIAEGPRCGHGRRRGSDEAAARAAGWSQTPPRKRSGLEALLRIDDAAFGNARRADIDRERQGLARCARRGRLPPPSSLERRGSRAHHRRIRPGSGANRIIVDYQPIGVCVSITPWNFPAAMATRKIAPALAAGCTVVLKPASETPLTAYALAALHEEAGVPPGVVNVLTVSNPAPATAAMLADPRVRKLSFTGSTELAASSSLKRPSTSSRARWNSAATRRSSSSTTPISRRRSTARW